MPTLHIAIPAMAEAEYLPSAMASLSSQVCSYPYHVYVCVNQPESYWEDGHTGICEENRKTLEYLHALCPCTVTVLDCSSRGKGWTGKKTGVGQARKVLCDHILQLAADDDIFISFDADTTCSDDYLQSIGDNFESHKRLEGKGLQSSTEAIAVPYYHNLTGHSQIDEAILGYEIYMRHYLLQMIRIGSPYAFTALGSAIAVRCGLLRRLRGITPLQSGEDFYLLQRIAKATMKWKNGHMVSGITLWNDVCVNPATRLSDRVPFGTGPAIAKACQGDIDSYPLYAPETFNDIREAYNLIPELYKEDINTSNPFLKFLEEQFKDNNLWKPLKRNSSDLPHFAKAFHEKADGLRILQYLRNCGQTMPFPDNLSICRERLFEEEMKQRQALEALR